MLAIALLAIPGAAELIKIVVVVVLLLVIIFILRLPQVQIPAPFNQWAVWVVAAIIVIFLLWEALTIAGIV